MMTWEDGEVVEMRLDQDVASSSLERVRYVPQGFFDSVTNETAVSEGGKFYGEIKKAIYSHVPADERLGCACLDDLVLLHTRSAEEDLTQLRSELSQLNRRIAALEQVCSAEELRRHDSMIEQKEAEIAVLEGNSPVTVPAPAERGSALIEIEEILEQIEELRARMVETEGSRGQLKRQRAAVDRALQAVRGEERRVRAAIQRIQQELDSAGVTLDVAGPLSISFDCAPFEMRLEEIDEEIRGSDALVDSAREGSFGYRLLELEARREALEQESESAASAYQSYLSSEAEWSNTLALLHGAITNPSPESLRGLRLRREELTRTKPAELKVLEGERREKCKEIFGVLEHLAKVHERIARPVREHIAKQKLTRERYQLAFDVKMGERRLADRLFSCVGQQTGSFAGVQQGGERLRRLVSEADFTSADGAASFADALLERLKRDHRSEPPGDGRFETLLKRGATIEEVYDLVL